MGDLRHVFKGWALSDDSNATNTNLTTALGGHGSTDSHGSRVETVNEPSSCDPPPDGPSRPENSPNRPIESTHAFIFWWKDWEAEARFKDPLKKGIAGGLRELGRLEWKTGFEDMQESWMNEGMRVDRYPLTLRY